MLHSTLPRRYPYEPQRRFSWWRVAGVAGLTVFCATFWIAVGYAAMWLFL